MQPIEFGSLSPSDRAQVIYTQARSEMTDRLWQAALGGSDDKQLGSNGACEHQNGLSLASVLSSLTGNSPSFNLPGMAEGIDMHRHEVEASHFAIPQPPAISSAATAGPQATTIDGLGANSGHANTLELAASRTGMAAPALAAIVDAEAAKHSDGSWNLHSRNPRSSAAGLGQFLSRTWIGMAEREGTWLNDFAEANGWLDDRGRALPQARGQLLAMRYDAEASIQSIADYAKANIDTFEKAGIRVGDSPAAQAKLAYLGHHLGPGDASRFLNGGLSEDRAARLLKAQIGTGEANRRIGNSGSAAGAHRQWLNGYIDSHIRPDRYSTRATMVDA